MRRNVLNLTAKQANIFFLVQKNYVTLELPDYFIFTKILADLSLKLEGSSIGYNELNSAIKIEEVNHTIYSNKDGKYAWRKLRIINPYLYVSLVNLITGKDAWIMIQKRFEQLHKGSFVECLSIPVLPDEDQAQKASQISEWVNEIDRASIKLALEFEYLFQTDITNCYGSIYTHSIAWALHDKTFAKKKKSSNLLLGNKIDKHLRAISYGQTNGIPQGSLGMDFIAEIVLAYADFKLTEKLKDLKIVKKNIRILRYRDDYRIMVRNAREGESIMKVLGEVLADLGMSLNSSKTKKSEKIILDSIKPDKLVSTYNPILDLKNIDRYGLEKELLRIYALGTEYPNSGQVKGRLDKIDKNVEEKLLQYDPDAIVSLLTSISIDCPSSFYIVASLISKSIKLLQKKNKKTLLNKVFRKINLLPNSGLLEVWLHRITSAHKIKYLYKEKLCSLGDGKNIQLFDTSWITSQEIAVLLDSQKIVAAGSLDRLKLTISRKEIEIFSSDY